MDSNEEVLQACAAIVAADALLEKPKRRRKKLVNDYLLEWMTKGSYGGLLTELSLEKEIFKEYLRMIQSIPVSSKILCIQYFCIHQRYCILQKYRVSKTAVIIQSISVWRDEGPHSILVHSIAATPNKHTLWLLVLNWGSSAARGDIQTLQIRAFFRGAASAWIWVNLLHAADGKYLPTVPLAWSISHMPFHRDTQATNEQISSTEYYWPRSSLYSYNGKTLAHANNYPDALWVYSQFRSEKYRSVRKNILSRLRPRPTQSE